MVSSYIHQVIRKTIHETALVSLHRDIPHYRKYAQHNYGSKLVPSPESLLNHVRQRPRHLYPRLPHLDLAKLDRIAVLVFALSSSPGRMRINIRLGRCRRRRREEFTGGTQSWRSSK
jgi:hypothetical protein